MVQLGARVAAWGPLELSTLRELWRLIPAGTDTDTDADGGDAV